MRRLQRVLIPGLTAIAVMAAVPPVFFWYYEGPRTSRTEDGLWETYMRHGGESAIEISTVEPDTDPTTKQIREASRLLEATTRHAEAWRDYGQASTGGGFTVSNAEILGRPDTRFMHLWSPAFMSDERVLDPSRPESLIFQNTGHGMELVGVMYVAPPGQHGPQVGGSLTRWHYHPVVEFCMDDNGVPTVMAENGTEGGCPAGMVNGPTPEMMHVWLIDNPHGAFSHMMAVAHDHHAAPADEANVYAEFVRRTFLWVQERAALIAP